MTDTSHPASHVAVAITLNAQASSLKSGAESKALIGYTYFYDVIRIVPCARKTLLLFWEVKGKINGCSCTILACVVDVVCGVMAASDLKCRVKEVTTCPVCLEEFVEAKSLPCVHSFCRKCLEGYCSDKLPGQTANCPLCRTGFLVPENGIISLPDNYILKNLVDAKKCTASDEKEGAILCEVCMKEDADELDSVPAATVYCENCSQNLCKPCSRPHKRWIGGAHQLRSLDSSTALLQQQRRSRCDKHELKLIELYCFDCKVNLCRKCFEGSHKRHKCGKMEHVAHEFSKRIDADIKQVRQRMYEFNVAVTNAEAQSNSFVAAAEKVKSEIAETGEKVKQFVDKHVSELQREVDKQQTVTVENISAQKDSLSLALATLESYTEYVTELNTKGLWSGITMSADKLHLQANELLQTYPSPVGYYTPALVFTHSDVVDDLMNTGDNIIGYIGSEVQSGT